MYRKETPVEHIQYIVLTYNIYPEHNILAAVWSKLHTLIFIFYNYTVFTHSFILNVVFLCWCSTVNVYAFYRSKQNLSVQ